MNDQTTEQNQDQIMTKETQDKPVLALPLGRWSPERIIWDANGHVIATCDRVDVATALIQCANTLPAIKAENERLKETLLAVERNMMTMTDKAFWDEITEETKVKVHNALLLSIPERSKVKGLS